MPKRTKNLLLFKRKTKVEAEREFEALQALKVDADLL